MVALPYLPKTAADLEEFCDQGLGDILGMTLSASKVWILVRLRTGVVEAWVSDVAAAAAVKKS